MAVCLVTGGAGFIGSHLVEALVARHHAVRVLDNCTTGTLANLAGVMDAVELYLGDLADLDFVRRVTAGVDVVFHHAARTSEGAAGPTDPTPHPAPSVDGIPVSAWPTSPPHHPEAFAGPADSGGPVRGTGTGQPSGSAQAPPVAGPFDADVLGTIHVLTAAREAGVRRVLYASSMRVYGQASDLPCREENPVRPLSPYALAKLGGEQACMACTRLYGLETVRLRYAHVFGPRQPATSPYAAAVREVLSAQRSGGRVVVSGDGPHGRDLIYVEDAVHATLLAATAPRVSGKVYNVGRGRPTTARAVAAAVKAVLGTDFEVTCAPKPPDDLDNVGSTTRAEVELGFCASTDLEHGLRRCIESWARPAPLGLPPTGRGLTYRCGF